jgi:hypothetical protein
MKFLLRNRVFVPLQPVVGRSRYAAEKSLADFPAHY